jgi:hypothetical protein
MSSVTSLLDFILNLLKDPQAQAEFKADPQAVLASNGLTGVCAEDIHDTLPLVTDNRAVEQTSSHTAAPSATPAPGESDTHAAVRYLSYITNTYSYTDDHNTAIDESVHQNIWAAGDVTQTFDNNNVVSSGHGSVAAGGDISGSTVTTGQGDAVGSGAAAGTGNVTGSGNALGDGSAAGTGNAVANGDGSTIGNGNTVANGDHSVQGDGNVQGTVSGNSQVGTTGGEAGSDSSDHSVTDSDNTDLHSYGSGATNTLGNSNTSGTATGSGNSSDSHDTTASGNTADSGNAASSSTTTGSGDDNGSTHVDSSSVGNTYHDSTHDTSVDSHDAGLELHLH